MNYLEKVRYLKKLREEYIKSCYSGKYHVDIRYRENHWQQNELEALIKPYPYVPQEYIEFIKEFDNLGLAFVTFYGSKYITTPGFNPVWNYGLVDYIKELSEYTNIFKYDYFPFGKDVDGSVFAFNQKQQVIRFDIKDYDFVNEPEKVANNFEEFIGDYVLGKNSSPGSSFREFLQSLGWV